MDFKTCPFSLKGLRVMIIGEQGGLNVGMLSRNGLGVRLKMASRASARTKEACSVGLRAWVAGAKYSILLNQPKLRGKIG